VPRFCIAIPLLALALALSACGGDNGSETKSASSTTPTTNDGGKASAPHEAEQAKQEDRDKEEQKKELKQQAREDRQFDKSFTETSFERIAGKLPIRKPPLYVQQYITGDGHKVYTAVDRKTFCKLSVSAKQKAVASYFKSADALFRAGHVNDFQQVVTPVSDSIEKLPALATASGGSVKVTPLGRGC
jgi:hypothetical protein